MKKIAVVIAFVVALTLAPSHAAQADDVCSPIDCVADHRHVVCVLEIDPIDSFMQAVSLQGKYEVMCPSPRYLRMKVRHLILKRQKRVVRIFAAPDCDRCLPDRWVTVQTGRLIETTGSHVMRRVRMYCHDTRPEGEYALLVHLRVYEKNGNRLVGRRTGPRTKLPCHINLDRLRR